MNIFFCGIRMRIDVSRLDVFSVKYIHGMKHVTIIVVDRNLGISYHFQMIKHLFLSMNHEMYKIKSY